MLLFAKRRQNSTRKIAKLFTYQGLKRTEVEEVGAGDIVCISGISDINIGETVCDVNNPEK